MTRKPARKAPAKRKTKSRAGKHAKVKPAPERAAADAKAAQGALPQWTTAQIAEAFRRFKAANPEPKGELQHINPFTLLVAVVLSAQATDAGVNKATPALFALADTPEKMAALGEAKVRDLIKTIGLFRNKAKNVAALSQKLIAEHGSQVPRSREALEAFPASAARPPTSFSTLPSASRRLPSIRTSFASETAPDWPPARPRSRSK